MGVVKGEGVSLQQGIQELKSMAIPPARFNQEMHAHALASSRDQLLMPPLAAQLCSAQISESRAEASALMARQPRLETRDAPAAASQPPILGGDVGVYIKWALVLQEQLAHVQGERAGLAQQVVSLQQENERLRQTVEASAASSATPLAATPGMAAAAAVPGAACADAASAASAVGDSVETLALSASDQASRSATAELALPNALQPVQAESSGAARRSARGAAAEAPPPAFLPQALPQQGVQGTGVPQQVVTGAEPAALPGAIPAPELRPAEGAAAGAAASAPAAAGAAQKRQLDAPPSPFSSPNLRFLAGFLDAPGLQPSGGAPPLWGHGEQGREEGKLPGASQAKLQRGANTAKTISRFDNLQPGR